MRRYAINRNYEARCNLVSVMRVVSCQSESKTIIKNKMTPPPFL